MIYRMGVMLVVMTCGVQPVAAGSNGWQLSETAVREWLLQEIANADLHDPRGLLEGYGITIEWRLTRSTRRPKSELEAEWASIAPFPDHPDRRALERHLRLSQEPDREDGELGFAGADAWYQRDVMPGVQGPRTLTRGGTHRERWMLFDRGTSGQLTIIHAGMSYPVSSNVGRYLDMVRDRVRLFLLGGMPHDGVIESVEGTSAQWRAVVLSRNGGWTKRISGSHEAPDRLRIDSVKSGPSGGPVSVVIRLREYQYQAELNRLVPRRVVFERSNGIHEEYELIQVRRVTARQVRDEASRPAVDTHIRVVDYNTAQPHAGAQDAPQQPMMLWRQRGGVDTYEAVAPDTTAEATELRREQRSRRGVAIIVAGVIIVIVPVLVAWRRWIR